MSFRLFIYFSISILSFHMLQSVEIKFPTSNETAYPPNEEIMFLDLSYLLNGNVTLGKLFTEEELIQKILSYPNLQELNLSGQILSPSALSVSERISIT